MGEITRFPLEMQPARPYPSHLHEFQPDREIERLEDFHVVYDLVQKHGADRVVRFIKTAASIQGQENGQ